MVKPEEKCSICEGKEFKILFSVTSYEIEECNNCSLVRTKNFKEPSYQTYHRDDEYEASEKFFKCIFELRFNIISKYKKAPGRVLDIGAATGVMLDIFKEDGWETHGIEPSGSYERAKLKGHNITHSTLEKAHLKEKFDVVIANHVLEHIEDPQRFLSICKRLLNKDGYLYVDVPNFGSLRSKIYNNRWKYILPKEHVNHFTETTLSKLLQKEGFEIVFVTSRSGIFETSNPFKYLLLELVSFKKNFFLDIFSLPMDLLVTALNKGDSIGIVCKK